MNNALKDYITNFCKIYNCDIDKIALEAKKTRYRMKVVIESGKMNIDTYFALCGALSRLSAMYNEGYYLVRIKNCIMKNKC